MRHYIWGVLGLPPVYALVNSALKTRLIQIFQDYSCVSVKLHSSHFLNISVTMVI